MAARATTVVGIFTDVSKAEQAAQALRDAGFRRDRINVIVRDRGQAKGTTSSNGSETYAEEGAATGAITGGIAGTILGVALGTVLLPGLGTVLATSVAAGLLGGATGATAGGLIGGLIGLGIPEKEATGYAKEIEEGRVLLTVRSSRPDEVRAVLRRYGATDLRQREQGAAATTTAPASPAVRETRSTEAANVKASAASSGGEKIEVREEELHARKRPTKKGEVRVRKEVKTEHKTLEVPVTREEVVVERTPVHRRAADANVREGEEIRIPVREEEVTVEKTPVVKEEVRVNKRQVHGTEQVAGTVRKEQARVEREGDVNVRNKNTGK